ncbi:oligopeptide/dipeptide ABC transporter, ATP-binding protein, C-terminal domain-containing protein [Nitratireductor aquibiodomus]|uniref:Oligopeptide/dipeptide ABC transporter, ATP-binding protein, C-terminal domain-containing protein n=1 Tax=Nitratireductor aquibiodomus TaxID=204799 RepID=A0A1H4KF91_9HYPH|nr:ABC transporter ATP-binding protein [Nitratireductor aquibiodomus]SEB57117.1 oligopeptide/dipeptide ABC transporter, ATP-binding protein, C-terminal domain-containing protein [Nitratireductor aquibiodomus]
MNGTPLLSVEDLHLTFSKGSVPPIIEGVSFEVHAGETLCIVGESGCGKSVTSMALMGLLPTPPARVLSGRAMFAGEDLFTMSESRRASLRGNRMAMIFQEPMSSLNPSFTIGHQIIEGIRRHNSITKTEAHARAIEVLRMVRIPAPEARMAVYPHQMSGGMRQRVMIAMALANQPQLLIADEPTTALDVTIQAQILKLVKNLQDETGTAMILITHDLSVVAEVADRVAVMYAGKIVESGTVEQIFSDPQHPYTIGLFGSVPSLGRRSGRLATIEGSVPPLDRMPAGCRFVGRCPFADRRCHEQAPPAISPAPGHTAACWYAPLEEKAVPA